MQLFTCSTCTHRKENTDVLELCQLGKLQKWHVTHPLNSSHCWIRKWWDFNHKLFSEPEILNSFPLHLSNSFTFVCNLLTCFFQWASSCFTVESFCSTFGAHCNFEYMDWSAESGEDGPVSQWQCVWEYSQSPFGQLNDSLIYGWGEFPMRLSSCELRTWEFIKWILQLRWIIST